MTELEKTLKAYQTSLEKLKAKHKPYVDLMDYSRPMSLSLLQERDNYRKVCAAIGDPEKSLRLQIRDVEAHILVITTMIAVSNGNNQDAFNHLKEIQALISKLQTPI